MKPAVVTDIGSSMDLFVTAARLAGATLHGRWSDRWCRFRKPLTGPGPSPRQALFYYWDNELRAIRKGRYKART